MRKKKKKVLIATDGSDFSIRAVDEICDYIDPKRSEVKVVSAYFPQAVVGMEAYVGTATYYNGLEKALRQTAKQSVDRAAALIHAHFADGELVVETRLLRGPADTSIIEEATRWNADLIVVGSHGYGFLGRMLGSVSNSVVHHAPCPVLVVRSKGE